MPNYEFNGEKYRKASAHQNEWGSAMIEELGIKDNAKILDLGCGDGRLTRELALHAKNGKAVGIDASYGMLDKAKEFTEPNLEFIHMDINRIAFDNEFDIIFSNAALHWVKDHSKLLINCFRALKPGGRIRFNFACEGNCETFFSIVKNLIREKEYIEHFKDFVWPWYMPSVSEYEKLMAQTNFTDIKIWEQPADRYFKNAEEITGWIDQPSIVPFLQEINNEKVKIAFRDETVDIMLRKTRQPDGTYFEKFIRINVDAEKPLK